jgi:hypothetical protein
MPTLGSRPHRGDLTEYHSVSNGFAVSIFAHLNEDRVYLVDPRSTDDFLGPSGKLPHISLQLGCIVRLEEGLQHSDSTSSSPSISYFTTMSTMAIVLTKIHTCSPMAWFVPAAEQDMVPETGVVGVPQDLSVETNLVLGLTKQGNVAVQCTIVRDEGRTHVHKVIPL